MITTMVRVHLATQTTLMTVSRSLVAEALGMSDSTFGRKLRHEGTSWQQELDRERFRRLDQI